jgi:hypothetical protein
MQLRMAQPLVLVVFLACGGGAKNVGSESSMRDASSVTPKPGPDSQDASPQPTPDGGPASADPCGDGTGGPPACTPELFGVRCSWEACVCCVNGGVCGSDGWTAPSYNLGSSDFSCPVGSGGPDASLDGSTCGTTGDGGGLNRTGTCPTGTQCCAGTGGRVGCYAEGRCAQ